MSSADRSSVRATHATSCAPLRRSHAGRCRARARDVERGRSRANRVARPVRRAGASEDPCSRANSGTARCAYSDRCHDATSEPRTSRSASWGLWMSRACLRLCPSTLATLSTRPESSLRMLLHLNALRRAGVTHGTLTGRAPARVRRRRLPYEDVDAEGGNYVNSST